MTEPLPPDQQWFNWLEDGIAKAHRSLDKLDRHLDRADKALSKLRSTTG